MKLQDAVWYIELIKSLSDLLGRLTAIEIPPRMYTSIRHIIAEAHETNRPVPVSDAINSIQMKHKSISVDNVCIWPEDKAPEICEWDEIMYEAGLIRSPMVKHGYGNPITCFSDIINTGYMLTMERPKQIRMNAAAVHEMHIAVNSSSHMVASAGSRALILNGVKLMPLPNSLTRSLDGTCASVRTMTVDEAERIPHETVDALMRNPWDQEPWVKSESIDWGMRSDLSRLSIGGDGSSYWKGHTEKPKDLFDLEKEMGILINNLKG